jgi:hypothetical protein
MNDFAGSLRACPALKHQNGHQTINPDITPLCRDPAGQGGASGT